MPDEVFNGIIGGILGSVMSLQFAFNLFYRFKVSKQHFLELQAKHDAPVFCKRYFFKWYAFTVVDGMKIFCPMQGQSDADFAGKIYCQR